MKPTRRTQPMRKQPGRRRSGALAAAMRGATASGSNPMDAKRAAEKKGGLKGRLNAKVAAIPVRGSDGTPPPAIRKLPRYGQVPWYARDQNRRT